MKILHRPVDEKYTQPMTNTGHNQHALARHISGTLAQAVGFYVGVCADLPDLIAECENQPMIPAGHAQMRRDALEIACVAANLRLIVRAWEANPDNVWEAQHDPHMALDLIDLIGLSSTALAGVRVPTEIGDLPLINPNEVMDLYEAPALAEWEADHPPLSPAELRAIAAKILPRAPVTPVR